jgi:hypothetical protein
MTPRNRNRLYLVIAGVAAVGVISLLLFLDYENVFGVQSQAPPEGAHDVSPMSGNQHYNLDPGAIKGTWTTDPSDPGVPIDWPNLEGGLQDGHFDFKWGTKTVQFGLHFRADQSPPVRLRANASLARENSFNITYLEGSSFSGEPANTVLNVTPGSTVDYLAQDAIDRQISGAFDLEFTVGCVGNATTCPSGLNAHTIILQGGFPVDTLQGDLQQDSVPAAGASIVVPAVAAAALGLAFRQRSR